MTRQGASLVLLRDGLTAALSPSGCLSRHLPMQPEEPVFFGIFALA
jgi:hypothetical protein